MSGEPARPDAQALEIERLQEEMIAVSRLADTLVSATTLAGAYESVVAEIGRLAGATAAVLLHHDPRRPGHVYLSHAWAAAADDLAALRAALGGLHEDCGAQPEQWEEQLRQAIATRVAETSVAHLAAGTMLTLPPGEDGLPRAAVWMSRPREEALARVSPAFVRYAGTMLENHARARAGMVMGAMGGRAEADAASPLEVLERAAKLLHAATDCEAALVYSGGPDQMSVTYGFPARPGVVGLPVWKGSLTWECIHQTRTTRILDVADHTDELARRLDRSSVPRLMGIFGWTGGRSWICCPVVHKGRCVGAIKVLTSDRGRFLGPHHELIAQAVAERAALEIHKMSRALMLEALGRLAGELASKGGGELADAMVDGLKAWIERFVRPGCEVAVLARALDRTLVFRCTKKLDEKASQGFESFSRALGREAGSFGAGAAGAEGPEDVTIVVDGAVLAGVAVPVALSGQRRLGGHLFVLHPAPFSQEDRSVIREAAREMAVLLNGERLRHEWTLNAGLFRHALLGPVQGLTSAARLLGVRAEEAGADVAELRIRVDEEAEIIRLWRENQRLYLGGAVEIRAHPQDLRPVVERCLDRYRELLEARHIGLSEEWEQRGPLRFTFDEQAVDLALSNLLDNARKYTFFNREVIVGVRVRDHLIEISVEDVGHPIPERLEQEIYAEGKRLDWADPFRVITGQGLGLSMARAIVEQHGGRLYHTSERDGRGANDGTTPYRVRFTIELPHHWTRRKRHG